MKRLHCITLAAAGIALATGCGDDAASPLSGAVDSGSFVRYDSGYAPSADGGTAPVYDGGTVAADGGIAPGPDGAVLPPSDGGALARDGGRRAGDGGFPWSFDSSFGSFDAGSFGCTTDADCGSGQRCCMFGGFAICLPGMACP